MIVDGDGHFVEPISLWDQYVEPGWRDRVRVEFEESDGLAIRLLVGDFVHNFVAPQGVAIPFGWGDGLNPGGLRQENLTHRRWEESHPGGWFAAERLRMHDEEAIDAAVLFATLGLIVSAVADPPAAAAACAAVNRWAADYASEAPDELYIVATLPTEDPVLAAAELRRAVEEHGFVGGAVRPNPTNRGRTLDDPSLDVLWSTAVDLDVPICLHNGSGTDLPQAGLDRCSTYFMAHAVVHPVEALLAFGTLYQGGVFERHPRLRVGFMESGCGWVPFWLDRLDEHLEQMGWFSFDPMPSRAPSQVFVEQCVVGCEGDEPMIGFVQERVGVDRVLWASDFPHFDTEPPFVKPMLERDDLTENGRDGVLRGAAVAFYGLDEGAIGRSVERRRST